ncbi:MAG: AAA family ATPase [Vicinamibacteria bacterium]|nr:AAA family ATPase [Vicinamibacteria bacterium]
MPSKEPEGVESRLREPAEQRFRDEIQALAEGDQDARPAHWALSPRAVLAYIVGGSTVEARLGGKKRSVPITTKFYGDRSIVERAIVTLASERALLLLGEPGTGKSWLSEHLAAAISGNSTLTIQGTAGTTEEHIKYSWNIARVIAEGPQPSNLIPSPTMVAMRAGGLLRFEELTRCVPDVQDALVSILSDKAIAVPELPDANMVWAKPGFNVIATANTRDQGVNDLSAALKRRFNYIHIPVIRDAKTEVQVVRQRSAELLQRYDLPVELPPKIADLITTVFREIREGKSEDGVSLKQPTTTLSTAEAIGVAVEAALRASFFGRQKVDGSDIARNLLGSVVKEDASDLAVLREYATLIAKKRGAKDATWDSFYQGLQEVVPAK